ncbi:hypothetical protein [Amphibacillus jilinensis]|uniref:hypothetical protein n=1 Tax=Amphibacillus jilinensis TaxID=1216008 RepID=UPI0003795181|nr:hypothetical protein [Amphibacillus jilinensis]
MSNPIYQQLRILGVSQDVIVISLLLIIFFILFVLLKPLVHILTKRQYNHILTLILAVLLFYLVLTKLTNGFSVTEMLTIKTQLYLLSSIIAIVSVCLFIKKLTTK